MSKQASWVVVADAARARIFSLMDGELTPQDVLTHPESQMHTGDLRTGGKGESIESHGAAARQADPQVSTMEKHAERFAKEIAEYLRLARTKNYFERLIIVAAPQELGRMRDNLDSATAALLEKSIDKNWAQHDSHEIGKLLNKHI